MRSMLLAGLLMATSLNGPGAQDPVRPRSAPPFLGDAMPLEPVLETPHLTARADGPVKLDAKGKGTLTVVVTPKPGMHVYAHDAEGYTPFMLSVETPSGLRAGRFDYPSPGLYVFPPTGEASRAYVQSFRVTIPVTATDDLRVRVRAARSSLPGVVRVRYQACDDRVCYRPGNGAFVFSLE